MLMDIVTILVFFCGWMNEYEYKYGTIVNETTKRVGMNL